MYHERVCRCVCVSRKLSGNFMPSLIECWYLRCCISVYCPLRYSSVFWNAHSYSTQWVSGIHFTWCSFIKGRTPAGQDMRQYLDYSGVDFGGFDFWRWYRYRWSEIYLWWRNRPSWPVTVGLPSAAAHPSNKVDPRSIWEETFWGVFLAHVLAYSG